LRLRSIRTSTAASWNSPEETFDAFDLADEDRELLRHPDHRLLRVLGAALAEENATVSAAASVATMAAPPGVAGAPLAGATRPGAPPGMPRASAPDDALGAVLQLAQLGAQVARVGEVDASFQVNGQVIGGVETLLAGV
jgi:hypothetical protein